jgi:hypothetical protein
MHIIYIIKNLKKFKNNYSYSSKIITNKSTLITLNNNNKTTRKIFSNSNSYINNNINNNYNRNYYIYESLNFTKDSYNIGEENIFSELENILNETPSFYSD